MGVLLAGKTMGWLIYIQAACIAARAKLIDANVGSDVKALLYNDRIWKQEKEVHHRSRIRQRRSINPDKCWLYLFQGDRT